MKLKNKINIAKYLRVSVPNQSNDKGLSIEAQNQAVEDFIYNRKFEHFTEKNMSENYIIYVRLSSDDSILKQKIFLNEFANKNSLAVVHIFIDTGSTFVKRSAYMQMKKALLSGKVKGVICMSIDRLARSVCEMTEILDLIACKDIEIVTPQASYNVSKYSNYEEAFIIKIK